ncbi:uncharacterized protein LOC143152379 [Ptiloglossa arizonensis]|uniref:uncharacterized protein LOC143152379 n=1 Tax=Ptiloglossa arizonensis TaxID=3350558 RepID=UPI003F9EDD0F
MKSSMPIHWKMVKAKRDRTRRIVSIVVSPVQNLNWHSARSSPLREVPNDMGRQYSFQEFAALLRRQMGQCNDGDLAFYESRNDSGKRGEILAGQELDAFKLPS